MSKREASMFAAQGVDVDAPRAKRQKTGASLAANATGAAEGTATSAGAEAGENEKAGEDPEQVKERGLKLWQTIKDARDKDDRQLSLDFLRLPSKRQYPDYYEQIKRPIALDDIKRRLDGGGYAFFDEVKGDFEQCFKNAKKYNMKESQIWKDAKHLHKLVLKESSRLTGVAVGEEVDDAEGHGEAGSDGEEGKKKKAPNMNRLLKTRLQKLVDKTDDSGRVLSAEFMELPNRKQWGMYYKLIKKPQCFENIFKRLKRKEYHTPVEFANDVELVFSNALEFNQEHTPIWEDAVTLRDYFRQLMSDLPPPFTIPAYASQDRSTKVKLKIPQQSQPAANQASSSTLTLAPVAEASPRPRIAIPAPAPPSATPTAVPPATFTSVMSPPTVPKAAPTMANGASVTPPVPPPTSSYPIPLTTGGSSAQITVQPAYPGSYPSHYPTSAYHAPVASPSLPNSNSINPTRPYTQPQIQPQLQLQLQPPPQPQPQPQPPAVTTQRSQSHAAKSPTPVELGRPLRFVSVLTKPLGRRLDLDYREGVRTWAARLGPKETAVRISKVAFLDDADEQSDGEEREHPEVERHEEEEEEEDEPKQEKPKRGRGRPKKVRSKSAAESPKGKGKAKSQQPVEDGVQVKLNSVVVTPVEDGVWNIELPQGSNVVEVGAKGGMTWRAYLDRI